MADLTEGSGAMGRTLYPAGNLDVAIHPGETLAELFGESDLRFSDLKARTGLSANALARLMCGQLDVTEDVAQRLENGTGTPAHLWLRLQADYDRVRRSETREGGEIEIPPHGFGDTFGQPTD